MKVINIPLARLQEAAWNPNTMTPDMLPKLRESITRYGIVENLVVRTLGDGYEVISGNQRLRVYRELGRETAPCVVVDLTDAQTKLLAQVLNRTRGEDDLGLKAALVRDILADLSEQETLSLLPETSESLSTLASLGQADMASQLAAFQRAQAARLHHLTLQFPAGQLEVVEDVLRRIAATLGADDDGNPNKRSLALYHLCLRYLKDEGGV